MGGCCSVEQRDKWIEQMAQLNKENRTQAKPNSSPRQPEQQPQPLAKSEVVEEVEPAIEIEKMQSLLKEIEVRKQSKSQARKYKLASKLSEIEEIHKEMKKTKANWVKKDDNILKNYILYQGMAKEAGSEAKIIKLYLKFHDGKIKGLVEEKDFMFVIMGFYEESGDGLVFGIFRNHLKFGLGTYSGMNFKQIEGGLFDIDDEDAQNMWENFILVCSQ